MPKPTMTELKSLLPRPPVLLCWLGLIGVFGWSYWAAMGRLVTLWIENPTDYGHGWFVPVFAAVLLWVRREMILPFPTSGSWWGIAFFALWVVMRWTMAHYVVFILDTVSVLPWLTGLALFIGGWQALRWAWPSIVFLIFMMRLPELLGDTLRHPLQMIGTKVSVFIIQTLGMPAMAEGNVINLTEGQLGIVEACSGLRMLMLFFAVCVGSAFLIRCPLWQKIVIVLSAIPIAVFANVMRITITAILYEAARKWPSLVTPEKADHFFHDWAGYFMMPLAMLVLWGEMVLLGRLFLEPVAERPLVLGGSLASGLRAADSRRGRPM